MNPYNVPFDDNCTDANDGTTTLRLDDEGLLLDIDDGGWGSREITDVSTLLHLTRELSDWLYRWQCPSTFGPARCERRKGHIGVHNAEMWTEIVQGHGQTNVSVEWSCPIPVKD